MWLKSNIRFPFSTDYFAIQKHGYIGAAAVTLIVEALVFLLLGYYIIKASVGKGIIMELMKVIACWLLPVLVIFVSFDISNYIRALLWSIGFVILLRLTRSINDEEWNRFFTIIRRAS